MHSVLRIQRVCLRADATGYDRLSSAEMEWTSPSLRGDGHDGLSLECSRRTNSQLPNITTSFREPVTMKNQVKKNNHEVTRAYLQQWMTNDTSPGLNWLDLTGLHKSDGASIASFEPARSKKRKTRALANFAVQNFLYVPLLNEKRNDSLEDELARYENQMMRLCRAKTIKEIEVIGIKQIELAIMGCLTHAARDAYNWLGLHDGLTTRIAVNRGAPAAFRPAVHKQLVQNARSLFDQYRRLIPHWEWTIFCNVSTPLLVSERPCFDMRFRAGQTENFITMPLSPHSFLFGYPAKNDRGSIEMKDLKDTKHSVGERLNVMTIERARQWIVGSSASQVSDLMERFTYDEFSKRVSTDSKIGIAARPRTD
jgi:hypothetical protein